jgi:signal transduction histidine kinase/CheY-like chemotaxis protein
MLTNISNEKNKSLISERSEGQDVGTIGGYCEDGFPIYYDNDKIHMPGGYHSCAIDELLREQLLVFDTLARNFKNVYFVDLEKETARILKLEDDYVDVPGKKDHHEFPFEAVVSHWVNTIVYPEDREKVGSAINVKNVKKVFGSKDEIVGNYRSLVNGEIHHFQYTLNKADKDGTKAILGFQNIDDIIEEHLETDKAEREKEAAHQKEVEEQLAIINALSKSFRNVFVANMNDGMARVIRLDDKYNVRAIREVNGQTFPFNAVIDRWVRETVHPEDKQRVKEILNVENLRKIFSEQDKCVGTYRNMEDGVQHYYQYDLRKVDDAGNVVAGFQVIDSIIEEQKENQRREKQLEEAHLREEKEHAEVVNSISTIYSTIVRAEIDSHEYEILNSVPLMRTVAACKGNLDDVKDKILEVFVEPEFREALREFLDLNTLADRFDKVNTIAIDYKAPTGQWMQARFIVKRRDENGRAVETLYVAHDITEEKTRDLKRQEALTHALTDAQQANRAKTTFLNSMSHDIRTPMNAIIGFTALAQMHLDDHEQAEDYLNKISTSSNHLLSLINDILDMSRIESGMVKLDEKAVHIPDLLQDLRTMIQSLVNSKNLNLCIDTQNLVHEEVMTDKLRLNQVLLNIVGNAIKFTQPGGDILIRLVEKPCNLNHYATYEFSVKDNGIGMSKDFVGHIFDTFSREYSSTVSGIQGTGLGMAISKNIVDMMGGDIQVESEEGKGSLFTVTLNLRLANETAKKETIPELLGARAKSGFDYSDKHALLVEDNELNREIATAILEETGMTIDSVEDGDIAVATINREAADKYDLVLMDIQMPRMDGYTATREIRTLADNKKANIPIVAMTANAFEEDKRKAFESGMNGHIIKPINIEEIAKVLDEIFAERK